MEQNAQIKLSIGEGVKQRPVNASIALKPMLMSTFPLSISFQIIVLARSATPLNFSYFDEWFIALLFSISSIVICAILIIKLMSILVSDSWFRFCVIKKKIFFSITIGSAWMENESIKKCSCRTWLIMRNTSLNMNNYEENFFVYSFYRKASFDREGEHSKHHIIK